MLIPDSFGQRLWTLVFLGLLLVLPGTVAAGDGRPDLVVAGENNDGYARWILFRNDGSGSFTRILEPLRGADDDQGTPNYGLNYASLDWGDFDGDGLMDLAASGSIISLSNDRLIVSRNEGSGRFTMAAEPMGTDEGVNNGSVAWGDFDNDGDSDLAVSGAGDLIVFRSNGDGTFSGVAEPMGPGVGVHRSSIDWGDYNNDGLLDLVVTGQETFGPHRFMVFRNNGDGSFTLVSEPLGSDQGVEFPSVRWGDYNNDGLPDLAVSGETGSKLYLAVFRNEGGGSFSEVWEPIGTQSGLWHSSLDWGDFDGDGRLDLAVSGYTCATGDVDCPFLGIYTNTGGDSFSLARQPMGSGSGVARSSLRWGDYNGDGAADLVVSGEDATGDERLIVFRNNGDGTMTNVAEPLGTNMGVRNSSVAWADAIPAGEPSQSDCASGEEAGDTISEALDHTQTGACFDDTVGTGSLAETARDDGDYYRRTLNSRKRFELTMTPPQDPCLDYNLALLGPSGEAIAEPKLSGCQQETIVVPRVESTGDYFVRIRIPSGPNQANYDTYSLVTTVSNALPSDRFEENDTFDSAAGPLGDSTYVSLTLQESDPDFYAHSLTEGDSLTASIDFSHLQGNLDLALFDPAGSLVASSTSTTDSESVTLSNASTTGEYVIRVRGNGDSNVYSLTTVTLPDDRFEENDVAGNPAGPLGDSLYSSLLLQRNDPDFYAYSLNSGDPFNATIGFRHSRGNLELELLDPGGAVVDASTSTTDHESVHLDAASMSGNYVLRVYGNGDTNSYSLNLLPDDRFEDNDVLDSPAGPLNDGFYGSLILRQYDPDYYAHTLTRGDRFSASIDFTHAEGNLSLFLLNPLGDIVASSTSPTDDETLFLQDASMSGEYVLKVFGQEGNDNYSLLMSTLRSSSDTTLPPDRFEENDTFDSAAGPLGDSTYTTLTVQQEDPDFYTHALRAGDDLFVRLRFSHAQGDLGLEILGPSGDTINRSNTSTDDESLIISDVARSGDYGVHVYGNGDTNFYEMTFRTDTGTVGNAQDDCRSGADASSRILQPTPQSVARDCFGGDTGTGQLLRNSSSDSFDHYRVSALEGDSMTLRVAPNSSTCTTLQATLADTAGRVLDSGQTDQCQTATLEDTAPYTGFFLVSILHNQANLDDTYALHGIVQSSASSTTSGQGAGGGSCMIERFAPPSWSRLLRRFRDRLLETDLGRVITHQYYSRF